MAKSTSFSRDHVHNIYAVKRMESYKSMSMNCVQGMQKIKIFAYIPCLRLSKSRKYHIAVIKAVISPLHNVSTQKIELIEQNGNIFLHGTLQAASSLVLSPHAFRFSICALPLSHFLERLLVPLLPHESNSDNAEHSHFDHGPQKQSKK